MDLSALVLGLVGKFPVIAILLMVIGVLRMVNKPLFVFLHAVADATPSPTDNAVVDKVEHSVVYKGFCFVIDYLFSIKLIK